MQGNKYLNFEEFKLTVQKIASPSDFADKSALLAQIPFTYFDQFIMFMLEGYSMQEAFNKAVTLYHFYK